MTKIPDNDNVSQRKKYQAHPALRLVTHYDDEHSVPGPAEPQSRTADPPRRQGESRRILEKRIAEESRRAALNPELHPNDPRWILAAQTIQSLQGPALNPTKRAKLLRKATHLGIRPFDANLVIAIVQDQARQNISGTDTPAETFKFKHADLADRLQIIPHVGVPSIRNLPPPSPPSPSATPPATPPATPSATSDTATEFEAVRYRVSPFLRLAILLTVTLALTAGLLSLLITWLFGSTAS